jgi:DNA polymerase-1
MNNKLCLELREVREFLEKSKTASLDTETTALRYTDLDIEGISMCNGTNAIYIPFLFRKNEKVYWKNNATQEILTVVKQYIEKMDMLIMHNAPFDLKVLHKYGIYPTCELFDTMVAQHLIDENSEKGLKKLAHSVLGYDTDSYDDACEDTGSKRFIEYAINDAIWTWELAMKQKPLLQANGTEKLFREIEMPFQYVLTEMAVTGIQVDVEKSERIQKDLVKNREEVIIEMLEELNEPYSFQLDLLGNSTIQSSVNFSSPTQLSDILFNKLGLECIEQTPSGKPSVGKVTLLKYKDNSFVKKLQKYKIIDKLLSGFFNPMPEFVEKDGKVRPNFKDCGTRTGRMSCVKPNLQQLPKPNKAFPVETRSCFIVPKGHKMITCDYSGQENRVMAHVSKDKVLCKQLEEGWDAHLATANAAFKLGVEEECLSVNHPKFNEIKNKFEKERNKAKAINFGLPYGIQEQGLSNSMGVSEAEAKLYIDNYYEKYQGVKKAIDDTHNTLKLKGELSTEFGRIRHFDKVVTSYGREIITGKSYRQSFNFLIQGYSADMIRKAMVDVYNMKKDYPEWDLKTIATVHDEAVWQVKEEYVDVASKKIKEVFESAVTLSVPVLSDIGIGDDYSQAK